MRTQPFGPDVQDVAMQDQAYPVCEHNEYLFTTRSKVYVPVCSHKNFDVSSRVETVKLIDQFQHGPLDLIVTSSTIVKPCATNGIDFIEENDASLLAPRHLKQLSDHTCTFTDILLNELRTDDTNECGICSVGYCSCTECFSCSGRTKQQNTFGRVDTEIDEPFRLRTLG